jgi:hypothetical protein
MKELLDQIDAAKNSAVYYLALTGALTVPDIAGALAHESGKATGARYREWVTENLSGWGYSPDQAQALWSFRCSLLHQNTGQLRTETGTLRLYFTEPGPQQVITIHNARIVDGDDEYLMLDVPMFCTDMTSSARSWLARHADDAVVQKNLERSIRRYPMGLSPILYGAPVIA